MDFKTTVRRDFYTKTYVNVQTQPHLNVHLTWILDQLEIYKLT